MKYIRIHIRYKLRGATRLRSEDCWLQTNCFSRLNYSPIKDIKYRTENVNAINFKLPQGIVFNLVIQDGLYFIKALTDYGFEPISP